MKNQGKISVYEKEVLVIKSHILKYIKSRGYRTNNLTPRALNDAVFELLDKAIQRTKLSKRKTVFPKDI